MIERIILLDVDDVLADFEAAYFEVIHRITGLTLRHEDRTQWNILAMVPEEHHALVEATAMEAGFCSRLVPIVGAHAAVLSLQALGKVYAVTAPWPGAKTWYWEREQWLREHFDIYSDEVLHVTPKHLVRGNVIIEDKRENALAWAKANPEGLAILWDMPYNQEPCSLPNVARAKDWPTVVRLVRDYTP